MNPVQFGASVTIKFLNPEDAKRVAEVVLDEYAAMGKRGVRDHFACFDDGAGKTIMLNGSEGLMFAAVKSAIPKLEGLGIDGKKLISALNDIASQLAGRTVKPFCLEAKS